MAGTPQQSVSLYYREGSSDKVYQARIEPKDGGFVVNFAFGRRGATLQTGSKTSSPVPFEKAKAIYDKIVHEKLAKGYSPGQDGTPYRHTDAAQRVTGILPQLLNSIGEAEVQRLIQDSEHCAQEKFDGRRVLLRKTGAEVIGVNRRGLSIGLPESVIKAAQAIPGDFVMDGECVGDVFYSFDLLEQQAQDCRSKPYRERNEALVKLLASTRQRAVVTAETAITPAQKAGLLDCLRRENKEGIVFKRLDAHYKPGRPASGGNQLKHKFYATLSAVVAKVNAQRSVELRLANKGGWQSAGNVTIPSNQPIPKAGATVEIRYLYAFKESGCLYQPTYLGERKDIEEHECTVSQLKFKAEEEEG